MNRSPSLTLTHPNVNSNPISFVPNIDILDKIKRLSVMHRTIRTCRVRNKLTILTLVKLTESLYSLPNKIPKVLNEKMDISLQAPSHFLANAKKYISFIPYL